MTTDQVQSGIVVGVDGSPSSTAAVGWAARDAQLRNVPLRLVNVVAPASVSGSSMWMGVPINTDDVQFKLDTSAARQILDSARKTAAAAAPRGGSPILSEVLVGPVVPTLADYSEHADMLVVGCGSRTAFPRSLLGSVTSRLDHQAHCPLGVVHDDDSSAIRSSKAPVAVGIDNSATSDQAIEIAFEEASRRGVGLIALHAWSDDGPVNFGRPAHAPIEWANFQAQEQQALDERLAGWTARYPDVSVQKVVVADRPVPRLLRLAESAQLLVLGSHAHRRLTGMLRGSVSSAVVNAADIPVIVAHNPRLN